MTEQTQVKRKPGRPAKVREPQSGPVSQEDAEAIIAEAEDHVNVDGFERPVPDTTSIAIPLSRFSPDLLKRIQECNEISIVCKLKRKDNPTVSINHSRHDANWLKDYV